MANAVGATHHIKLGSNFFVIAKDREGKHLYSKEESPFAANKFSSGDPTYRDLTFWQYFAQVDWSNGSDQELFNDGGRYWKSLGVDVNEINKMTAYPKLQARFSFTDSEEINVSGSRVDPRNNIGMKSGKIYRTRAEVGSLAARVGFTLADNAGLGQVNGFFAEIGVSGTNNHWAFVGPTDRSNTNLVARRQTGSGDGTWGTITIASGVKRASLSAGYLGSDMYIGCSDEGRLYKTSDFSTFTLEKTFKTFSLPWVVIEYGGFLYVLGGAPYSLGLSVDENHTNGEMWRLEGSDWRLVYPFHFTEVTSAVIYDNFLFIGTYHGFIYTFNGVSVDRLFEIPGNPRINTMEVMDDKLVIATESNTDGSIWIFDRNGLYAPFNFTSPVRGIIRKGPRTIFHSYEGTTNYERYVNFDQTKYEPDCWYQSSYFDANLPSIDKLWNQLRLEFDPLPNDWTFTVKYKFKESDSYTTLGTYNTLNGTSATFQFPAGTISKQISYRVEFSLAEESEGASSPTSGVNDSSNGTTAWTNPGNILASDNSYATVALAAGGNSQYLHATGFGFTIPTTASIKGIKVEIERSQTGTGTIKDLVLYLSTTTGTAITVQNKADTTTAWPTTDAYATYGSNTDTWEANEAGNELNEITPADVNDADFGIFLRVNETGGANSATARVDHVRITVYYLEDDETPTLKSSILQYALIPDVKWKWDMTLVCADDIELLDRTMETNNGKKLLDFIENARKAKKLIDFQDIDYANTTLNGSLTASATTITVVSTSRFAEADSDSPARIRIEDEVITYTGKTATTFTGCVRGAEGTTAASHSDTTLVHNGYKVLFTQVRRPVNLASQSYAASGLSANVEGEVQVTLLES